MLKNIFTANRVAAISTWLAGLGALIAAVAGTMPHAWQNAALGIAGLLVKTVVGLHFMTGSQKYDALVTPYPTPSKLDVSTPAPVAVEKAVAALPDPAPVAAPVPPPVA